jgi:hypothetical protein
MTIRLPNNVEPKLSLALLCFSVLLTTGCFTRKPPSSHLAAIHLGAPNVPAADASQLAASPPEISLDESPDFPQLVFGRNVPQRPRVAPVPAPEPSRADKSREPIIVPEVTTEEMVAAKNESQQSLDIAERNLSLASGKSLNAMQQDLISKVRGFSDSAREAMKTGDWIRAKNFSKKAEVLSSQLASSL